MAEWRAAGKTGQVQNWRPVREQGRRLLRLLERGPERALFRSQEPTRLRAQAQEPLR